VGDSTNTNLLIAKSDLDIFLIPKMANRHGMIAGATGTGKTVTLQTIAESLSRIGVPVFMADVKTDLSGISKQGSKDNGRVMERLKLLGIKNHEFEGCPVTFWDVFGEMGHPIRATISDMGPLLLSRLLDLNDTQTGVLNLVFKIADDNGLLLLDIKDLRAMLQNVGDNASQYTVEYGNISVATIGIIQRQLLALETQGGDKFFGEPALDINDLFKKDNNGKGYVNILSADKLLQSPKVYSTFLLWLLSELFEQLPEVGDLDKPKLVFFFDEAHLLFDDAPEALLDKIEQVVRLIRSKGVGVFFISQNPLDVPDAVLGQLGNRVQHALRAFTPRDQKAVNSAATTFRQNPELKITEVITELEVGEALVSMLENNGNPSVVQRAFIIPPHSQIGPISMQSREEIIRKSSIYGNYEKVKDRESAYELLKKKVNEKNSRETNEKKGREYNYNNTWGNKDTTQKKPKTSRKSSGRRSDSVGTAVLKSVGRSVGSQLGRQIVRGILGSIFSKK